MTTHSPKKHDHCCSKTTMIFTSSLIQSMMMLLKQSPCVAKKNPCICFFKFGYVYHAFAIADIFTIKIMVKDIVTWCD